MRVRWLSLKRDTAVLEKRSSLKLSWLCKIICINETGILPNLPFFPETPNASIVEISPSFRRTEIKVRISNTTARLPPSSDSQRKAYETRSTQEAALHDLALVALGGEHNVVLEVEAGVGVALAGLEVDEEVVLDGEDGVGLQPGVVTGVELGGAALVVGVGDHDVDVGGPHGVPVHELEELVRGAVGGQAVGRGVVAVEPVPALLVGAELGAEVVGSLVVRVLEIVLAVGRRLPDVEDGAGDGLAGQEVRDSAVHESDAAIKVGFLDDGAAELTEGSVGGPEGPEDGRGGGVDVAFRDDLVGDLVNEPVVNLVLVVFLSFRIGLVE